MVRLAYLPPLSPCAALEAMVGGRTMPYPATTSLPYSPTSHLLPSPPPHLTKCDFVVFLPSSSALLLEMHNLSHIQ